VFDEQVFGLPPQNMVFQEYRIYLAHGVSFEPSSPRLAGPPPWEFTWGFHPLPVSSEFIGVYRPTALVPAP